MANSDAKANRVDNAHPFQRLQNELAALIKESNPGERLPAEPNWQKRWAFLEPRCAKPCVLLKARAW
jgi:hypothetical protein